MFSILYKVRVAWTFRVRGSKEKLLISLQTHSCISSLTVPVICVRRRQNELQVWYRIWALVLETRCLFLLFWYYLSSNQDTLALEVMGHIRRYGSLSVKSTPLPEKSFECQLTLKFLFFLWDCLFFFFLDYPFWWMIFSNKREEYFLIFILLCYFH